MRSFTDEICAVCQGKKYPRQCRNSIGWRAAKVRIFDDLADAQFKCKYGLKMNFLGNQQRAKPERAARCKHLLAVHENGCCDPVHYCRWRGNKRRLSRAERPACLGFALQGATSG